MLRYTLATARRHSRSNSAAPESWHPTLTCAIPRPSTSMTRTYQRIGAPESGVSRYAVTVLSGELRACGEVTDGVITTLTDALGETRGDRRRCRPGAQRTHRDDDPAPGAGFDEYRARRRFTGQVSTTPIVGNLHPHPADRRGRRAAGMRTRERYGRRYPRTRTGVMTNQGHRRARRASKALDDRAQRGHGRCVPKRCSSPSSTATSRAEPITAETVRIAPPIRPGGASTTTRSTARAAVPNSSFTVPTAPRVPDARPPRRLTRCTSHSRPSVATTSSAATPASA